MRKLMNFSGVDIELLEINGTIYFNPYDVGKCLELSDSAVRMATSKMTKSQCVKLTKSIVKDIDNCTIPPSGKLRVPVRGCPWAYRRYIRIAARQRSYFKPPHISTREKRQPIRVAA